jgi:hypothetical protein
MGCRIVPSPLRSYTLTAPSVRGLNTEASSSILGPEWAVSAQNCVFDNAGRLAARKGWVKQHTSQLESGADIESIHHALNNNGSQYIWALNNKIYKDPTTPAAITGTITTPTANHWQFQNFNNKVVGWQDGHAPIVWSGTGNFADISFTYPSAGTSTWGNTCLAAYGRIFTTDSSNTVIKYSDLLVENSFTDDSGANGDGAGSAGIIDLKSVWVYGRDEVTALAAFNGQLIIFGKRSVTIYSSGSSASPTDFDPTNAALVDIVYGVGCIARDSVQTIGNDIWFLSDSGVRSLSRTVLQDKMPLQDISKNIKKYLINFIDSSNVEKIKSIYNEKEGLYLLTFPSSNIVISFDIRQPLEDGSHRVTVWTDIKPTSFSNDANGDLYTGHNGYIGKYQQYQDNGVSYNIYYKSGWMTLDREASKINILKRMIATFYTGASNTVDINWNFDFKGTDFSYTKTITGIVAAEYSIAEYSIGEYSGGGALTSVNIPVKGNGALFRFGFDAEIDASVLAFQKFTVHSKLGRLAT